jgi:hypothetical protein
MTALTLCCADPARAATPALLVGPELEPVKVSVQSMGDGTLNYFDSERRLRSEPASSFLQIRLIAPATPAGKGDAQAPVAAEPGWLELIDGQRYPGRLTGSDDAGQNIDWTLSLPTAVTLRVSLERVRSIRWPMAPKPQAGNSDAPGNAPAQPAGGGSGGNGGGGANDRQAEGPGGNAIGKDIGNPVGNVVGSPAGNPNSNTDPRPATPTAPPTPPVPAGDAAGAATGDVVTLANGDRVTGFVQAIRLSGLELRASSGSAPLSMPVDRLAEVVLSSGQVAGSPSTTARPRPMVGAGTVVLRNGARLSGTNLRLTGDAEAKVSLLLSPAALDSAGDVAAQSLAVSLPVTEVERIELQSRAGVLLPLASLPLSVTEGGSVFGLPAPPRAEAGDLLLHAPLLANVELPPGTRRVSMKLSLALPTGLSRQAQRWPDFVVTIEQAGKSLGQFRLNQQSAEQLVNVAADAGMMRIKLDASLNGPVLDRLRVSEGVVLVK